MSRRTFFRIVTALSSLVIPVKATRGSSQTKDLSLLLLTAAVDTIVPADKTVGAVDAEIDRTIATLLDNDPWKRKIYQRGLGIIDELAYSSSGEHFHELALTKRTLIIASLTAMDIPEARQFYRNLRDDVLNLFYTSETGQASLHYERPSQGYPDYTSPVD